MELVVAVNDSFNTNGEPEGRRQRRTWWREYASAQGGFQSCVCAGAGGAQMQERVGYRNALRVCLSAQGGFQSANLMRLPGWRRGAGGLPGWWRDAVSLLGWRRDAGGLPRWRADDAARLVCLGDGVAARVDAGSQERVCAGGRRWTQATWEAGWLGLPIDLRPGDGDWGIRD
jgi:hypothetical protein